MLPDDSCASCGAPLPAAKPKASRPRVFCSDACQGRAEYARIQADPERSKRRRAYGRWYRMVDRCRNPDNSHWHRYGGRGIYVHARWLDFDTYYADTGDAPKGMTLDRMDNDGPYSPENVRWATPRQQRANQEYDPMRIKTQCKNGHAFDEMNTHVDKRGWRSCRECARQKVARQRANRKAAA